MAYGYGYRSFFRLSLFFLSINDPPQASANTPVIFSPFRISLYYFLPPRRYHCRRIPRVAVIVGREVDKIPQERESSRRHRAFFVDGACSSNASSIGRHDFESENRGRGIGESSARALVAKNVSTDERDRAASQHRPHRWDTGSAFSCSEF